MSRENSVANKIPTLGLLSFAAAVSVYSLSQTGLIAISASFLGIVLLVCGSLQILVGLRASQVGNLSAVAMAMPLGMLWLSLIGFEVFPHLGIGQSPSSVAMFAYLSMWSLFAAILFLGSFQQSRALQMVFCGLLFCLLSFSLGELRDNPVFFYSGGISGIICGLAAAYTGIAQQLNQWMGRIIFPVGQWKSAG